MKKRILRMLVAAVAILSLAFSGCSVPNSTEPPTPESAAQNFLRSAFNVLDYDLYNSVFSQGNADEGKLVAATKEQFGAYATDKAIDSMIANRIPFELIDLAVKSKCLIQVTGIDMKSTFSDAGLTAYVFTVTMNITFQSGKEAVEATSTGMMNVIKELDTYKVSDFKITGGDYYNKLTADQ